MSDKPIAVNDLVMVVRQLPCGHGMLGRLFVVKGLQRAFVMCASCKHTFGVWDCAVSGSGDGYELQSLRRIDPPALPESVEHKESLTA